MAKSPFFKPFDIQYYSHVNNTVACYRTSRVTRGRTQVLEYVLEYRYAIAAIIAIACYLLE